jgi:predicted permease
MAWTGRFANLFRRGRVDAEIDEELRFHIEARTRDNVAAGMMADEAARDAQSRFGPLLRTRERTHDADVLVWVETLAQDVRYSVRSLRHSPVTTAIIIASLALAIGASTAVFSVVNAALLRALPYADSDRLAMLWSANLLNGSMEQNTSIPNFADWKTQARTFEDLAAYREGKGPLMDPRLAIDAQVVRYAWVTDNFFSLLGRSTVVGRVFTPDDFTAGERVAVVAHSVWQGRFGGATDVIGKRVSVGGLDVEIVGVMPADFGFPTKDVQLWMPASLDARWQRSRTDRATRWGIVFGRVVRDTTIEGARSEMKAVAAQLRRQHRDANAYVDVNLVPLKVQVLGKSVPFMLEMLFGAVLCVLLIACANVAHLLLARGVARRRELAVRAALGVGWRRIARQLVTESVLLSSAGGCLGLIVVAWTARAFIALAPNTIPRLDEARVDTTVLLFALALSLITGVLSGLASASRTFVNGSEDLMRPTGSCATATGARMRNAFVVSQFALAVVLLASAGLLIRSLLAVQSVDSGFGNRAVLTAHLRFDNTLPSSRRTALYQKTVERIQQLPGVRAVGAVGTMFWSGDSPRFGLRAVDGHPDKPRDQWDALTWTTIQGDYFQALGVPLLRGRFFRDSDSRDTPPVVLVNETMAGRYWPGDDPIGRRIKGFDARGRDDDWVTVVGVVKDVHSQGLERAPMAQIFEAQSQSLDETENLVVSATTVGLLDVLRPTIREVDRTAVLSDISTLDRSLNEQSAQRRFQAYLLMAFAVLALVLAAGGIFATMHYSVIQRTQEIGIRMALGAQPGAVLAMVLREVLVLTAGGIGVGIVGALGSTRMLSALLFGVTPHDPLTFVVVSLGLAAVAVLAGCIPASRAAAVDPILALRPE